MTVLNYVPIFWFWETSCDVHVCVFRAFQSVLCVKSGVCRASGVDSKHANSSSSPAVWGLKLSGDTGAIFSISEWHFLSCQLQEYKILRCYSKQISEISFLTLPHFPNTVHVFCIKWNQMQIFSVSVCNCISECLFIVYCGKWASKEKSQGAASPLPSDIIQ